MNIEPTEKTPGIYLLHGKLLFHGRWIISEGNSYIIPVFSWIKKYIMDPANTTRISINLEYIDSQSTQILFQMLILLKEVNKNSLIVVVWYYPFGDLEMLELGEILQGRSELDFEFNESEIYV